MVTFRGGHHKACLMFCILHLFVGTWKRMVPQSHPCIWLPTLSSSLATSIFSFAFEAWLVLENENQGYRQRALTHTFWLMTFFESASLIGSQVLANWLLASNVDTGIASSSTATIFIAIIGIFCVTKGWKQAPYSAPVKDRRQMSYTHIFSGECCIFLFWVKTYVVLTDLCVNIFYVKIWRLLQGCISVYHLDFNRKLEYWNVHSYSLKSSTT